MYELRPPAASLAQFIEHYWFVRSTADDPVDLRVDVYVDGRADLIFNHGAPYVRETIGGPTETIARSNLDAQRLVPIRIIQRGAVRTSGVRFRLGGLGAFATIPLREVTDRVVAPREALGPGVSEVDEVIGRLWRSGAGVDEQATALNRFFEAHQTPAAGFRTFQQAMQALVASDGSLSVVAVSLKNAVSPRHVERLFARYLGIPPKRLGRVVRFQRALRSLMRDPDGTLADVAADAGYFDQTHFIKDFREMTGGVPRGYRGYYPAEGPSDFAPNVVVFLQDFDDPLTVGEGDAAGEVPGETSGRKSRDGDEDGPGHG